MTYSSNHLKFCSASFGLLPQISASGLKPLQTFGRSGLLKMSQKKSSVRWIHLTKAGLPSGIPGMGELMEGNIQHAPQPGRHSMGLVFV